MRPKIMLISFFLVAWSAAAHAVGVDSSGGGFADRNALSVLQQASARLSYQLQSYPFPNDLDLPNGWDVSRIAKVLGAIQVRPSEMRIRTERPLLLDYDQTSEQIIALAPFFMIYGSFPEDQTITASLARDLEIKLIHEISHLWGYNELQADEFSKNIFSKLDLDLLICHPQVSSFFMDLLISKGGEGGYLKKPAETPMSIYLKDLKAKGIHSGYFQAARSSLSHIKSLAILSNNSIEFYFTQSPNNVYSPPVLHMKEGKAEFSSDYDGKWGATCQNLLQIDPQSK